MAVAVDKVELGDVLDGREDLEAGQVGHPVHREQHDAGVDLAEVDHRVRPLGVDHLKGYVPLLSKNRGEIEGGDALVRAAGEGAAPPAPHKQAGRGIVDEEGRRRLRLRILVLADQAPDPRDLDRMDVAVARACGDALGRRGEPPVGVEHG